jgi:hypothetical protein
MTEYEKKRIQRDTKFKGIRTKNGTNATDQIGLTVFFIRDQTLSSGTKLFSSGTKLFHQGLNSFHQGLNSFIRDRTVFHQELNQELRIL